MKKICLFYFSGTGMTKYIVDRLSGELEKHRVSVDCFKIEADIQDVTLTKYDSLGIAYPVHALNAPKIVIDFAKKLPEASGLNTFILPTAGSDSKILYSSSDSLINKLRKKDYRVFYNRLIQMPSNFAVKHDEESVFNILGKANEDIPNIAKDIVDLKQRFMKGNPTAKALTFIMRVEQYGAPIAGKSFHTKNNCDRCGKCVSICPNKNIEVNEKSIRFKWHCGLCLRCIYACPINAISIRRPYKFICFDKWYDSNLFK